jgi:hypothetical protein
MGQEVLLNSLRDPQPRDLEKWQMMLQSPFRKDQRRDDRELQEQKLERSLVSIHNGLVSRIISRMSGGARWRSHPQMQERTYAFIRKTVEEPLLSDLPRLMELTTSEILHTFPEHLKKLRLHGFSIPDSWSPIKLPSLVSLEIQAGTLDHLFIMQYIQVPQLRDLQVQVQDGLGELYEYDWRNTTGNLLDRISLTVKIPHHQQDNPVLVFHLPRTQVLKVSSPHRTLRLYITEPAPFSYTLHAILGAVSGPKSHWIEKTSAEWQEDLITEWINPHHGIPNLAKFRITGVSSTDHPGPKRVPTLQASSDRRASQITS